MIVLGVFVLGSARSCFVYFIVDLVVNYMTLRREGEREGKTGTVAA